jgi:hypothetical protein
VVAPFWDNFDPTEPETDGIYYAHDPAEGTFTIQWTRMRRLSELVPDIHDLETFQVVLRDPSMYPTWTGDGEILFLYRQVSNSDYLFSYASAGIEDAGETQGLQLTYSNVYAPGAAPLSPGLAVKITTERPVYSQLRLASFAAERLDEGVLLSWEPGDDRPVLGWQLWSQAEDGWQQLTPIPLPAGTRRFLHETTELDSERSYRLLAVHPFGQETALGPFAYKPPAEKTARFALRPCWPNPLRESTLISFSLPQAEHVRLCIYDLAGRRVRTLLNERLPAGAEARIWDGRDEGGRSVAGGVYFYRLETATEVRTRKLLLVR